MSEWILSVVGVICLGVLLEIVLPEGQTSKYVKGAFSLLVIFVIAAPLPKLVGGDFKLDFGGNEYTVDEAFKAETEDRFKTETEADIENYLALSGYSAEVKVTMDEHRFGRIKNVHIRLELSESEAEKREEKIKDAAEKVSEKFAISAEKIFVEARISGGGEFDDGQ